MYDWSYFVLCNCALNISFSGMGVSRTTQKRNAKGTHIESNNPGYYESGGGD